MNHIKNIIVALAAAAALSLVAGCGDLDAPAQDLSRWSRRARVTPRHRRARCGPTATAWTSGTARPRQPAEPERSRDTRLSRLDFGDNGLG